MIKKNIETINKSLDYFYKKNGLAGKIAMRTLMICIALEILELAIVFIHFSWYLSLFWLFFYTRIMLLAVSFKFFIMVIVNKIKPKDINSSGESNKKTYKIKRLGITYGGKYPKNLVS